jgi:hypothetical protein
LSVFVINIPFTLVIITKIFLNSLDVEHIKLEIAKFQDHHYTIQQMSSWSQLMQTAITQASITVTGLDCPCFIWLENLVSPNGELTPINNKRGWQQLVLLNVCECVIKECGSTMIL